MRKKLKPPATTHHAVLKRLKQKLTENLRAARNRVGLTQEEVASGVGMATEVYGRMERGLILPSLPSLVRMSQVLHADPSELLGQVDTTPAAAHVSMVSLISRLDDTPEMRRLIRHASNASRVQVRLLAEVAAATVGTRR